MVYGEPWALARLRRNRVRLAIGDALQGAGKYWTARMPRMEAQSPSQRDSAVHSDGSRRDITLCNFIGISRPRVAHADSLSERIRQTM